MIALSVVKGWIHLDIPAVSTALSQIETLGNVGTALLGKSLDSVRELGDAMVEMIDSAAMELSVNPGVGGNIDIRV